MLTAHQAIKVMRILVVNPSEESCAKIVSRLNFEGFEHVQAASTAEETLRLLSVGLCKREAVDLVFLSLQLTDRPDLACFNEINNVFDVALLLLAERDSRALALQGVGAGADDYMMAPLSLNLLLLKAENLLTRRFLKKELRRSTARNETLFLNVLAVMAKVMEAKDPDTRSHSEKVSTLSVAVAREMGFQDDEVRRIGVAGILHDLGKMGIREAILKKPGPLDLKERAAVERHPLLASTILEPIEQLQSAVSYIRHHHEHYDGSGYPEKLVGEQIPLGARVIHATEAFDAMVSTRSYNVAKHPEEALSELRRHAGLQFDPQVVEALAVVLKRSGQLIQGLELPPRSLPELLEDITGTVANLG